AIKANDTMKALTLLEQGADANTREKPDEPQPPWKLLWDRLRGRHPPPNNSRTALILACLPIETSPSAMYPKTKPDLAVMQALLVRGADVRAQDADGNTALLYAAMSGNPMPIKMLAEHGADVNAAESRFHITPLMVACNAYSLVGVKT